MKRRRIAIIGGGFSGAALATHLLRRGKDAPDITIIEPSEKLGLGLAYGTTNPAHLLNVRARNLSMVAGDADHFTRWLSKRLGGDQSNAYAPRMHYGRYIQATLKKAEGQHPFAKRLRHVRDRAIAVSANDLGATVSLRSGRTVEADAVVLAMGNPPGATPDVLAASGVPVIDPWDAVALKRVPLKDDVLLVGAGLTMVDVALALAHPKRTGVIYALSRRGLTPRPHVANPGMVNQAALPQPAALSAALHDMREVSAGMADRREPWVHAIDRLRSITPMVWGRLTLEQQQRFLRHARIWWDVHRHRMAPDVARQIAELQKAGKLKVLAGDIVSVEQQRRAIQVLHRQRGSMVRHRFDVTAIVNCTGNSQDVSRSGDALISQLVNDGVARPHVTQLGFDVDAQGRVFDRFGAAHANLYALGPVTQGAFWEITAVPEIRERAAALAVIL